MRLEFKDREFNDHQDRKSSRRTNSGLFNNRSDRLSFGRYASRRLLGVSLGVIVLTVFSALLYQNLQAADQKPVTVQAMSALPVLPNAVELVDVLVPVSTIEANRMFEPSMFLRMRRPKSGLAGAVVRNFDQIKGQYARSTIPANQPLHLDYVTDVRPANQVASSIPQGFRAVTINVNATTGVEGWAQAGARVDVAWISEMNGERSASTIVKDAKVISAERKIEASDAANMAGKPVPATVTLLASDLDAQKVSLAAASGSIILMLRGSGDDGTDLGTESGPITFKDLLSGAKDRDSKSDIVRGYVRVDDRSGDEWVLLNDGKLLRKGGL